MSRFTWSVEHEIFIAQIDTEHRGLFEAAQAFERAIEQKSQPPEVRDRLLALATQIENHLCHEEWLMQSVHYPLYAWHRQQHETARRRLKLFLPLIEEGNAEAIEAFMEFLAGWLADHTGVTDRMMAAFVRNYERAHATSALERWGAPAGRPVSAEPETAPSDVCHSAHVESNRR